MMLGFLLARAGVDVVVLEKHKDFLRDFRGDTIHPSTLELMYELGLLDEFLQRPHQEVRELSAQIGDDTIPIANFTHLPTHCKFVALMPQWDFLNFLAEKAGVYPTFHLHRETRFTDLIVQDEKIIGIRASSPAGDLEILADLTIGADGRHSDVRERAQMKVLDLGAPMDVMWMRLSRKVGDPAQTFGRVDPGHVFVLLNREDYWQAAFVIPKGTAQEVMTRGLVAFQETMVKLNPFLKDRVNELRSWDDVKLLTVAVDRLERWWRPGLLCIGDSAHAMSPIGGVGINLAIQDAVAAANLLAAKLAKQRVTDEDLAAVQERRSFPTRATQRLQLTIQDLVLKRVLASTKPFKAPWPLKMLRAFPILRRIPARVVGIGFRPEHVQTPSAG
jgi:2-polyprenyl-6-methoxyphenol hydroxylase-like FAD-dependent oxidoreductase